MKEAFFSHLLIFFGVVLVFIFAALKVIEAKKGTKDNDEEPPLGI